MFWGNLYSLDALYGYSTCFGPGMYQYNYIPSYYTPEQVMDMKNVFNPGYQFLKFMNNVNQIFNPFQNMQQMMLNQSAYNYGYTMADRVCSNIILNSMASSTANGISSLKSQLETALTSDKLTKEQKAELQALLEKVKALEEKLQNVIKLQEQGATNNEIKEVIKNIDTDLTALKLQVQETAQKIQQEIEGTEEEGEDIDDDTDSGNAQETKGKASDKDVSKSNSNTTGRNEELGAAPSRESVKEWSYAFWDAVDGLGTKNDKFETLVGQLDASCIIEVADYYDTHFTGGGLFNRILTEAGHFQKQKLVPILVIALETRAETLGIEDDVAEDIKAINSELSDYNISESIITKKLEAIANKIKKKEAANVAMQSK